MANQKITDLNKLQKLSKQDLLIVVDRSSTTNASSPTGETMAIEANTLASQLAEIHQGDVGIKLPALADVPNSYEGWAGGYLKITDNPNIAGEHEIEFTDAPGASEMSVPVVNENSEQNFYLKSTDPLSDPASNDANVITDYHVGDVLRRDGLSGKFRHAFSGLPDVGNDTSSAEVIGIIRKLKYVGDEIAYINIAFGGHIKFEIRDPNNNDVHVTGNPRVELEAYDQPNVTPTINTPLQDGKTYFLGPNGSISDYDPAESNLTGVHVSKPLLVATSTTTGVIVNYRGLMCEHSEEPHKFIVEHTASCSNVKVGDILRVKRKIQRFATGYGSSTGGKINEFEGDGEAIRPQYLGTVTGDAPYVMSNAATLDKEDQDLVFDDSYGCDMLGMVIVATTEFFQIQTTGMITFDTPIGQTNSTGADGGDPRSNREGGIFKRGYVYYLDAFDVTPDSEPNTGRTQLSQTIYDYTLAEYSDAFDDPSTASWPDTDMEQVVTGIRPFRNTTIHTPFERDTTSGKVLAYSKPVFYAVSERQILLLNQPAYPPPFDQCNAINPSLATPCLEGAMEEKNLTTTEEPYEKAQANDFLNSAWPTAVARDIAAITHQGWTRNDAEVSEVLAGSYVTDRWMMGSASGTGVTGVWSKA